MRKEQIDKTKQQAITLLKTHLPDERTNDGFGTLLAESIGVQNAILTGLKNGSRNMTLEKALTIINAVPKVLKYMELRAKKKQR